jgi:carbohydrate kinase (thermoresistant glucokinase family)
MGVSGSGKSTVGRLLAERLRVRFVDGDDLHTAANVLKMTAGTPLTDEDRWPWLDAVRREIARALLRGEGLVVACSALKDAYRRRLIEPREPVRVVFLTGSAEVIAERMGARERHFMPEGLLDSQFRDLETPDDALELDIRLNPSDLVERVLSDLRGRAPSVRERDGERA